MLKPDARFRIWGSNRASAGNFTEPGHWCCFEMGLQAKGLGDCARQVLDQMATIHSMDVVLPVKDKADVRLRLVAKPDKLAVDLLARMQLSLPTRPKMMEM